jgi:hypothetical protein
MKDLIGRIRKQLDWAEIFKDPAQFCQIRLLLNQLEERIEAIIQPEDVK